MNLPKTIAVCLVFVALKGTSLDQPRPEAERRVVQFVEFGLQFYKSINSKPLKQVIKKEKNRHDPTEMDQWFTVTYTGFKVEFLRAKAATGDLLSTVAIYDKSILLPCGIALGDSQEKVLQQLGAPSDKKPGALVYEAGETYSRSVTFQFKGGALTRVLWEYEID